ncbi:hypothetical protein O3P69_003419 [Scylla paramamosain]|uniref:Uncharacterized protein n=1 Tax=Scylla paramamosain TaxID=85552 RepID=A0AAW0UGM3_SCYPA
MKMSFKKVKDLVKETRNHTRLYWNYLRLQSLPHGLTENGSHVEQLHLKCNLLTKLPEKFGCLTHLTHCFLNSNSLESLPDSLGDLKSLKILDVANNNLTSLPVTLAKLSSLRSLVVVHNNLKSFPLELCGLKSLSILMLSGNYITSLPEAVKGLTGLQGLYIDHNLLKELPRSLAFLPILTRVSCCCNNIAYLPALPFASKPTIYFDNCEVNYLPITLVCHLHSGPTWDTIILHACGYFPEMVIEKNTVSITLSQSGKQKYPHSLVLPPQIRKVSSCASGCVTVPPLIEVCLSFIWRHGSHSSRDNGPDLQFGDLTAEVIPQNMLSLLKVGPVSRCSNSECKYPIFTYASIIVVTIAVSPKAHTDVSSLPMLIYFCSDACVYSFTNILDGKTDEFSHWLSEKLKRPHHIEVM